MARMVRTSEITLMIFLLRVLGRYYLYRIEVVFSAIKMLLFYPIEYSPVRILFFLQRASLHMHFTV